MVLEMKKVLDGDEGHCKVTHSSSIEYSTVQYSWTSCHCDSNGSSHLTVTLT